mmetsp:Transcript_24030/g.43233  ORF Transcript_24030/g.43233 Transcript_24030/m.43233 type:complete len:897 (-) Transcript_24030:254-2944(-)
MESIEKKDESPQRAEEKAAIVEGEANFNRENSQKFRSGWTTAPKVRRPQTFVPVKERAEELEARQQHIAKTEERKTRLEVEEKRRQGEEVSKLAEQKRLEEEIEKERLADAKVLDREILAKRAELDRLEQERVAKVLDQEILAKRAELDRIQQEGVEYGRVLDEQRNEATEFVPTAPVDDDGLENVEGGAAGKPTAALAIEKDDDNDPQKKWWQKKNFRCASLLLLLLIIGGMAGFVLGLGNNDDTTASASSSALGGGTVVAASAGGDNGTDVPTSAPTAPVKDVTGVIEPTSPLEAQVDNGIGPSSTPVIAVQPSFKPTTDTVTDNPSERPTPHPVTYSLTKQPTPNPVLDGLINQLLTDPVTDSPSEQPSRHPITDNPTKQLATDIPTKQPALLPGTGSPTEQLNAQPVTDSPTKQQTPEPTTDSPIAQPSGNPVTDSPSKQPTPQSLTDSPTKQPTSQPVTDSPTRRPTRKPVTNRLTKRPTRKPVSDSPTPQPAGSSLMEPVVVDRSCEYKKRQDVFVSVAPNFSEQQMYGGSSDFDGDTAVVVSYDLDFSAFGAGAVWILGMNEDGIWEQTSALQTSVSEQFGWGCSISGDTIVISAPGSGGQISIDSMLNTFWFGRGRAVVMAKDNIGSWYQQASLSPEVADWNAGFGISVDISDCGCFIAVGAWNDRDRRGSVYIFSKTSSGSWTEVQKLSPIFARQSESTFYGNYGYTVAITDDFLAAKAPYDYMNGLRGVVYVYERGLDGMYDEIQRLSTPEGTQAESHNPDMTFLDGHLLVGAPGNKKVYVFKQIASGYQKTAELTGSEVGPVGDFGIRLDGEGTNVMVADTADGTAVSYLFSLEGGVWKEKVKFDGLAAFSGNSIVAHSPLDFQLDTWYSSYGGEASFYDLVCER